MHSFLVKQVLSYMSYLHKCDQGRLVKTAYCASRVQGLG